MSENESQFVFKKIATIQSCYQQKFAIPRQPGLVKEATATIVLEPEFQAEDIVRGLAQNSHIWVIFVFHKSQISAKKNTVRPPRLGGEKRMGVFATRSNYRPNPIGQSVVKLEKIVIEKNQIQINVSAGDFLDGTPVLDIKPYIPYADCINDAVSLFAAEAPEKVFEVKFESSANEKILSVAKKAGIDLIELITSLLSYDMRPNQVSPDQTYATILFSHDLKWRIEGDNVVVVSFEEVEN